MPDPVDINQLQKLTKLPQPGSTTTAPPPGSSLPPATQQPFPGTNRDGSPSQGGEYDVMANQRPIPPAEMPATPAFRTGDAYTGNPYDTNQATLRPGIDRRAQQWVWNPNAFQYGGAPGMAESEANRYGNLAFGQQLNGMVGRQNFGQAIGQSQEGRAQQLQGLQYLQQQIQGNGPSVAAIQQMQGLQMARQQQATIAASARGGGANLAAAQQASAGAAAGLSGQSVQQAAMLRAQEQQAAMQQFGQQAGALRTGDFQGAGLQYQQQQLAAQNGLSLEQMRQGVMGEQMQGQMAQEGQQSQFEAAARGLQFQRDVHSDNQTSQWAGAALSAAAIAAMALSDERSKEGIEDAGADVDDAMSKLRPSKYEYKEPFRSFGEGPQVGIMAQHLAASKAGSTAVARTREGLMMVKIPQATGLALAGLARLNERLRKIEGRDARK